MARVIGHCISVQNKNVVNVGVGGFEVTRMNALFCMTGNNVGIRVGDLQSTI